MQEILVSLSHEYDPANLVCFLNAFKYIAYKQSDWFGLTPTIGSAFCVLKENKCCAVIHRWKEGEKDEIPEDSIPYEVIRLSEIVLDRDCGFDMAYLVLGGIDWKIREYYVGGDFKKHLIHADKVKIVTLEHFMGLVISGRL